MSTREVVLCEPVRTAIGAFNGSLKGVPATECAGYTGKK
jgi:acetyl-CoA C-acetyltransferase